VDQLPCEAE